MGAFIFPLYLSQERDLSKGTPPDWIEILPAGEIETLDGRVFRNTAPKKILEAFEKARIHGVFLPIDFEHATELRAPNGERVEAAGWIRKLEDRDGAIWGAVEWTDLGREALETKRVRYFSPAVLIDKYGVVVEILSGALTVRPAIAELPAIASRALEFAQEEKDMPLGPIAKLLELPEDADLATILAKIQEILERLRTLEEGSEAVTAKKEEAEKEIASLRKDLDELRARAESLLREKEEYARKEFSRKVDETISEAVREGKIPPASREYFVQLCAREEDLERLRVVLTSARPFIAEQKFEGDSLSNEEKEICAKTGTAPEEFLRAKKTLGGKNG